MVIYELSDIFSLLFPKNVEEVLINALPRTSRFALTFRYNAYRALMMGTRKYGQRIPLWVQRLRSVDAMENARKYIDHPLIIETMRECLEEIFDIPNTIRVLKDIEQGRIQVVEKNVVSRRLRRKSCSSLSRSFLFEKAPHRSQRVSAISAESLNLHTGMKSRCIARDEAVAEIVKKNNAEWKPRRLSYRMSCIPFC